MARIKCDCSGGDGNSYKHPARSNQGSIMPSHPWQTGLCSSCESHRSSMDLPRKRQELEVAVQIIRANGKQTLADAETCRSKPTWKRWSTKLHAENLGGLDVHIIREMPRRSHRCLISLTTELPSGVVRWRKVCASKFATYGLVQTEALTLRAYIIIMKRY
ncbi:hypothetical protein BD414DRAFT_142440 [Trametes punicea]|nr:hypothetical protein BD414DRAFT_142440 [Trametes punicea]